MAAAGLQDARLPRGNHRRTQIEPGTERPEPLASPSAIPATQAGRLKRSLIRPATMPTTPGCHAGPLTTSVACPLAACASAARMRIVQHRRLDLLALAVHRIEHGGQRRRLHRVLAQQQAQAQIGLGDAPGGIDARAQREAAGAGGQPLARLRHIQQRRHAGPRAARHHLQPLADQRAIDPGQRHHVAHGRQRHQVEQADQVRLLARVAKKPCRRSVRTVATAARKATAGGAQQRQAGRAVQPVRIDRGDDRRRRALRLVVVQHHDVGIARDEAQRLGRRGAAIHADDQARAAQHQRMQRRPVRPIALHHAIRHVVQHRAAKLRAAA